MPTSKKAKLQDQMIGQANININLNKIVFEGHSYNFWA